MSINLLISLIGFLQFFVWLSQGSFSDKQDNEKVEVLRRPCEEFQWTLLSDSIFPQWRDGIAVIARGDDLFLIGGWNPRTFAPPFHTTTNEIWKSVDGGRNWTLFSKAAFAPRHTFVCIDSDDGYVYVIGGDQYNSEAERAEVWRSKDLINWQLISDKSPFGNRMLMAGVEYKGHFFVGGGQSLPDFKSGKTDIYVSKDKGVTWQCLADSLKHMGKNLVGTMSVFNDRIYQVSGGWYGDGELSDFKYSQKVYSTTDGIGWIKEHPIPLDGVQYPNTIVFDDKLWCIAGNSVISGSITDAYNKNGVCYMGRDGKWHILAEDANVPKTHASSLIVYNQSLLMLAGNQLNSVYELSKQTVQAERK